ncbi:nuclear transport factor 2 family protein [Rhizobium sp. LC145]|uniref:nuclear transport factor 2 family protein n=1 Tax=Rhizobium sp. LC145 TaxID=1120688 RepID=UPI000629E995|nr:nuclear transport factor 2 family protein [Rhizobium sp. LC145]KKX26692.1 ketosteroid isomerase [Rhizobium sp. LC145]TKT55202.1 nuclear transport factor 2 family protein [Rhizobiaceae bacterium LC148]
MTFSSQINRLAGAGHKLLIVSALVATIGPAQANTAVPDTDIEARNQAIVSEAFDKWRAGGNIFAGLLAPDVVWTIHGSGPVAGTYRSVEDFIERASAPLISRLATPLMPEVHDIFADGNTVIIRFDGSATTTSGAPYRNQFVWIFRMEEGSVVEAEAFLDLAAYQNVVENNEPRAQ